MIVSDIDAADKWCPMMRLADKSGAVVNVDKHGLRSDETSCMGSDCMMWELSEKVDEFDYPLGYCGLSKR